MINKKHLPLTALGILLLVGLYLASLYNYLLFHSLVEIFSVVVACGIFVVAWNTRRFLQNESLLFLGIAYLFIGFLDLLHTFSYKGMGVFQGYDADLPTQLWIAARYVQGLSFLIAPFLIGRKPRVIIVFVSYVSIIALLIGAIFFWKWFPSCFVEGLGLTPFKKVSEYLISVILSASIFFFIRKRRDFDTDVFRLLVASITLTIVSELFFTFYVHVYGLSNLIGHYLKIISSFLIYRAIIYTGLTKPYALVFRNLKHSQQALRKERDFTSAVLSTAGALVVVLDRGGRIVRFNRACQQLTGYTFEEVRGRHIWDLFLIPEEAQEVKGVFNRLRAGQFPTEHEDHWVMKNGSRRLIMWSNTALLDEKGSVDYVIGTGIDVTQRRQAENTLRESERFIRSTLNSLSAHIAILDAEGVILEVNDAWRDFALSNGLGSSLLGVDYLSICDTAKGPRADEAATAAIGIRKVIAGEEEAFSIEYPCHSPETERWFQMRVTRFAGEDPVRVVVAHENITERKQAELRLTRARDEWERTFNAVPDLISIIDNQHRIVRVNKAMADQLACTPHDLAGVLCYKAVHGTNEPPPSCPHTHLLADGAEHTAELPGDLLGGHYIVSVSPLHDEYGELIGSVHVARDITQRMRAEESLRRAHQELERRVEERTRELRESEAELRRLSSELMNAHEQESKRIGQELHDGLAQSLSAIKIRIESALVHMSREHYDEAGKSLESIVPMAQDGVEEIRRISRNLWPHILDDLGVLAAISWLCKEFEATYPRVRIEKAIHVEEGDVPDNLKIVIFRVMQEALNNAAKHSQAYLVRLSLVMKDGELELCVQDNGVGLDPDKELAGGQFKRGLGLASMRERTLLSGGSLVIDSKKEEGTTVRASWRS